MPPLTGLPRAQTSTGSRTLLTCLPLFGCLLITLLLIISLLGSGMAILVAGLAELFPGGGIGKTQDVLVGDSSQPEGELKKEQCADIPEKLIGPINSGAKSGGLSPAFLAAIAKKESAWRNDVIYGPTVSQAGAKGMMQILPETWAHLGGGSANQFDPKLSATYGGKYLAEISTKVSKEFGHTLYSEQAIKFTAAGYNAGPARLTQYQGIPPYPETVDYANKVWAYYLTYRKCLEGGGGGSPGGGAANGNQADLAKQILAHQGITLLTSHVNGRWHPVSTAAGNIADVAKGGPAALSPDCKAGETTNLSPALLKGILGVGQAYRVRVSAIAGGCHAAGSAHYRGQAFDVDLINGRAVSDRRTDDEATLGVMAICQKLGSLQVLGPTNDASHRDHVHCGW